MIKEQMFDTLDERREAHLTAIVNASREIYNSNPSKQVRILDLATGPNDFNPLVIKRLVSGGIDYELTLSDISPTHFVRGYENLKKILSPEDIRKVKCILVDVRDLRADLVVVPLWGEGSNSVESILLNPKYQFLAGGYEDGKRVEAFEDESFDLILGSIPYSSINTGDYSDAVTESARVLREGGYHIVEEMQIMNVNPRAKRTSHALARTNIHYIDDIAKQLTDLLLPITVLSMEYGYRTEEQVPEQSLQNGDLVKNSVIIHKKD